MDDSVDLDLVERELKSSLNPFDPDGIYSSQRFVRSIHAL